jgi:hypothetical protein
MWCTWTKRQASQCKGSSWQKLHPSALAHFHNHQLVNNLEDATALKASKQAKNRVTVVAPQL